MTLQTFRDLLLELAVSVHHIEAYQQEPPYLVWREVGTLQLSGDGETSESGMRVALDYFTAQEYDPLPQQLQTLLAAQDEVCLSDAEIDYEDDTKLLHYAYTCEVM